MRVRRLTGPSLTAAYLGANSVVQCLFDKGATLDVVARDGRTPLRVAEGVENGHSFAAQPHTAALLRTLGATEIPCPAPCAPRGRGAGLRGTRHLSNPKGTPLANLSLTLLDKFGVHMETFGDCTGHLPLLSSVFG